jgi:hypothetical protein
MFGLCLLKQGLEGLVYRRVEPNIRDPRETRSTVEGFLKLVLAINFEVSLTSGGI